MASQDAVSSTASPAKPFVSAAEGVKRIAGPLASSATAQALARLHSEQAAAVAPESAPPSSDGVPPPASPAVSSPVGTAAFDSAVQSAVSDVRATYHADLASARATHASEVERMQREHDEALTQLQERCREEKEAAQQQHENELAVLAARTQKAQEEATSLGARVSEYESIVTECESAMESLAGERDAAEQKRSDAEILAQGAKAKALDLDQRVQALEKEVSAEGCEGNGDVCVRWMGRGYA